VSANRGGGMDDEGHTMLRQMILPLSLLVSPEEAPCSDSWHGLPLVAGEPANKL
jgi:hypothetical protein